MKTSRLLNLAFTLIVIPTQATAVSVWQSTWETEFETPVEFYLVTDFDTPSGATSGQLLDYYFDFSLIDGGFSEIDPADLLTQFAFNLGNSDPWDIVRNSLFPIPGPVQLLAAGPEALRIQSLNNGSYTQGAGPINGNVDCTIATCNFTPGFLDPIIFGIPINSITSTQPDFLRVASTVPVPAAVWLFGTALIGLVTFGRRRKDA